MIGTGYFWRRNAEDCPVVQEWQVGCRLNVEAAPRSICNNALPNLDYFASLYTGVASHNGIRALVGS